MDTIGTTRGFGDHDLKVAFCSLPIKPFLTPQPEVSHHLNITSGSAKNKKLLSRGFLTAEQIEPSKRVRQRTRLDEYDYEFETFSILRSARA